VWWTPGSRERKNLEYASDWKRTVVEETVSCVDDHLSHDVLTKCRIPCQRERSDTLSLFRVLLATKAVTSSPATSFWATAVRKNFPFSSALVNPDGRCDCGLEKDLLILARKKTRRCENAFHSVGAGRSGWMTTDVIKELTILSLIRSCPFFSLRHDACCDKGKESQSTGKSRFL
jgi:hypothetical protein